ncbi:MAG TPA: PRC-barrel domain-containing protein [Steroidobacteraceae bacterium]|nr:PRC-barrel domain-containing protein [Steroidobacteraceae bacterium]
MLRRVSEIEGYRVRASDGEIGKIEEIYFDDEHWAVRYLIVATGGWLTHQEVLISPHAVKRISPRTRSVVLALTRDKVQKSPRIDTNRPVSRQHEAEYYRYYGYPTYWSDSVWTGGLVPQVALPASISPEAIPPRTPLEEQLDKRGSPAPEADAELADSHLRSSSEVAGYRIEARDARVGHVEDFMFDSETWTITHLIVDTRRAAPARFVLLSPQSIRTVDWGSGVVVVDKSVAELSNGPRFDPGQPPRAGEPAAEHTRSRD